jgi:hypothetical protein
VTGPAQDRAGRGARDEEQAGDEQSAADDRRARLSDERREGAADREAEEAAGVLAEKRHETEEAHAHAEAKRTDLEEVAACEQEPAERNERDRQHVRRFSADVREDTREPRADGAAVEAEVEDRGEHEPECQEREPEQLVLVLRARALRPLLHACGDAWPKRPLLPSASHDALVLQAGVLSFEREPF